jgi:hypothetical protein
MANSYQFSFLNDFTDFSANLNWLTNEIAISSLASKLDYMGSIGDVLTIWFTESLTIEEQNILRVLVSKHRIVLPSGHVVFTIPIGESKWERYRETVVLPYQLNQAPKITVSNVLLSGASDLQIEEITATRFVFSIKGIGRGDQLGPNGVEFDWSTSI